MSKLRQSNSSFYSPPKNKNKARNNKIGDISLSGKFKGKLMSHGEFLNRIQKSLYYGDRKSEMSIPLSDYIADTFSETHDGYSLNRLNYSTVGNLRATPCSLILAMIYLERLKDADPAYTKHVTPTELFLVSMMVATKFYSGHDDEAPYVNWAECMNTTSDNLLQMELSFLNAIDWTVYVSNDEFFAKVKSLEIILARRQGIKRGFLTYVELQMLLPSVQIVKQFMQMTLVLGMSYTVFVATMAASVLLVSQIPGTYLHSSQASVEKSTTNSSLQQPINVNDAIVMLPMTTETNSDSNDTDLSVILANLDIPNETSNQSVRRKKSNIPMLFSSWYSMFKANSLRWFAIPSSDDICADGINSICNSSFNSAFLTPHQISFNGIKMKWV